MLRQGTRTGTECRRVRVSKPSYLLIILLSKGGVAGMVILWRCEGVSYQGRDCRVDNVYTPLIKVEPCATDSLDEGTGDLISHDGRGEKMTTRRG
jgi:hypothetical protein